MVVVSIDGTRLTWRKCLHRWSTTSCNIHLRRYQLSMHVVRCVATGCENNTTHWMLANTNQHNPLQPIWVKCPHQQTTKKTKWILIGNTNQHISNRPNAYTKNIHVCCEFMRTCNSKNQWYQVCGTNPHLRATQNETHATHHCDASTSSPEQMQQKQHNPRDKHAPAPPCKTQHQQSRCNQTTANITPSHNVNHPNNAITLQSHENNNHQHLCDANAKHINEWIPTLEQETKTCQTRTRSKHMSSTKRCNQKTRTKTTSPGQHVSCGRRWATQNLWNMNHGMNSLKQT